MWLQDKASCRKPHCTVLNTNQSGGTGRTAEQCCKVHPGFGSAVTEQSGSNLPSSCSHQQTVYCKKVAGSKVKCHPELKAYLLKKPEAVHVYEKSILRMWENHIPLWKAKSLLTYCGLCWFWVLCLLETLHRSYLKLICVL